ncbi:MAG: RNase adapter RapZ [Eubacterium sp.]|nr:RNase adapter RapZ [Eubacterium sp.]
MRLIIVSGMSGAGKTTALNMLEDRGFFCVDNLPVMLLPNFGQMAADKGIEVNEIGVGVDIRSGGRLNTFNEQLRQLKEQGIQYEILFLDAEDPVLIKRYKETRRKHPLSREGRIETGIIREREKIAFIREQADYIIDTSTLLTRELKKEIDKICDNGGSYGNFIVTVLSFGFKNGIPADADLVFDVRFLPNPYYESSLRSLTGNSVRVRNFVMKNGDGEVFVDKLEDLFSFLIPRYIDEGKNNIVIGIGCTGGRHRSVAIAGELYDRLRGLPCTARLEHRDIEKDKRIKG